MMNKFKLEMTVNGHAVALEIDPNARLLDILREELQLTGTKEGCGIGECGACTVIINGKTYNSCLVLAGQMQGRHITTIEGLTQDGNLHPLQHAFIEHGALQCGFCTPGLILSAKALLDKTPYPTRDQIKTAISGNLCRCTGYEQVIEAIEDVASDRPGGAR
jgi:carbon-monoxide dehydrogenase small subunit